MLCCAFQLHYEKKQGSFDDDKAVCGIEVECRGPGLTGTDTTTLEVMLSWSNTIWSTWSPQCATGTAICSIKTRVERVKSTSADGAAVTNVLLYCCHY